MALSNEDLRGIVAKHLGCPVREVGFETPIPIELSEAITNEIAERQGIKNPLGRATTEVTLTGILLGFKFQEFADLI